MAAAVAKKNPFLVPGRLPGPDLAMAGRALSLLVPAGAGFQLCCAPSWAWQTFVGTEAGIQAALAWVEEQSENGATAVYYSLNPVAVGLTRRALSGDHPRRIWILIDIDRIKTEVNSKLAATNEEHENALALAEEVREGLLAQGWPSPALHLDSGNGAHLLYPIDLANVPESQKLVRRVLHALAKQFDGPLGTIDTAVHDARRVARLPGTWTRKGPDSPDRPHRMARILDCLEVADRAIVPIAILERTAASAGEAEERPAAATTAKATATRATSPAPLPGSKENPFIVRCVADSTEENWVLAVLRGECDRMASARPGDRNNQLFKSAAALGNVIHLGYLSRETAEEELYAAALQAGCNSPGKDRATIRRGFDQGVTTPREPAPKAPSMSSGSIQIPGAAAVATSDNTPKPEIVIGPDEIQVNNQAVAAIAKDPTLFQRGGRIVQVQTREREKDGTLIPGIYALSRATLREHLASSAAWLQNHEKKGLVCVHPPMWAVDAVHDRGCWPGLRHLARVARTPTLRADGSILQTPGYDTASEQLVLLDRDYPPVPERPTQEDARQAARLLLDLVQDFPFEADAHRVAWLAGAITPLVRSAFDGPSPLFVVDANAAGSGKSLLVTVIGILLTGRSEVDFRPYTPDDEEMQKRLIPILQSGTQLVVLDNIATGVRLGSATLDMLLTGRSFKGRILGKSEETASLPLDVTWMGTGNNITYRGDTARRVVPIRLQCLEEKPEERGGFKIPRLAQHVQQHRPALVVAALTIVRGYLAAGRPDQRLSTFGSFEGWSDVVRSAVHWATGIDPCETRVDVSNLDENKSTLLQLLQGWLLLPRGKTGVTAQAAIRLVEADRSADSGQFDLLAEALMGIARAPGKMPTSRELGDYLRKNNKCVVGGMYFDSEPDRNKVKVWRVVVRGHAGSAGSPTSVREEDFAPAQNEEKRNFRIQNGRKVTPQTPHDPAVQSGEEVLF